MKFNNIETLIENSINISKNKKFCAIIGSNPSHGARSPLLWNAAFEKMNIDMIMISGFNLQKTMIPNRFIFFLDSIKSGQFYFINGKNNQLLTNIRLFYLLEFDEFRKY